MFKNDNDHSLDKDLLVRKVKQSIVIKKVFALLFCVAVASAVVSDEFQAFKLNTEKCIEMKRR